MYIVYSHSEAQLYCSSIRALSRVENEIAKSFFYSHQKVRVVGAGTDMFFMAMNVAGFFPGGGAHRAAVP